MRNRVGAYQIITIYMVAKEKFPVPYGWTLLSGTHKDTLNEDTVNLKSFAFACASKVIQLNCQVVLGGQVREGPTS